MRVLVIYIFQTSNATIRACVVEASDFKESVQLSTHEMTPHAITICEAT